MCCERPSFWTSSHTGPKRPKWKSKWSHSSSSSLSELKVTHHRLACLELPRKQTTRGRRGDHVTERKRVLTKQDLAQLTRNSPPYWLYKESNSELILFLLSVILRANLIYKVHPFYRMRVLSSSRIVNKNQLDHVNKCIEIWFLDYM